MGNGLSVQMRFVYKLISGLIFILGERIFLYSHNQKNMIFFGPKQIPDWHSPAKADFPFQILSSYFSLNTSLIVCESVQALHLKLSFHISICCMESI